MYDPFRLQILTVSFDSEVVLALVGVVLAGLVARVAARRLGRDPGVVWNATLDAAQWALVGARLGWVLTHAGYYARAPVQVVAVGDGGFLFAGGALAASWQLWRLRRRLGWTEVELVKIAAPAVSAALLLDRAGCALTACGRGQPTDLPWALVRSGEAVHPVGLYGVAVWLLAWAALRSGSVPERPQLAWLLVLAALLLDRTLAWALGHDGFEGALAAGALVAAVALGPAARVRSLADRAGLARRSQTAAVKPE